MYGKKMNDLIPDLFFKSSAPEYYSFFDFNFRLFKKKRKKIVNYLRAAYKQLTLIKCVRMKDCDIHMCTYIVQRTI